jgi:hypothetical protein
MYFCQVHTSLNETNGLSAFAHVMFLIEIIIGYNTINLASFYFLESERPVSNPFHTIYSLVSKNVHIKSISHPV